MPPPINNGGGDDNDDTDDDDGDEDGDDGVDDGDDGDGGDDGVGDNCHLRLSKIVDGDDIWWSSVWFKPFQKWNYLHLRYKVFRLMFLKQMIVIVIVIVIVTYGKNSCVKFLSSVT